MAYGVPSALSSDESGYESAISDITAIPPCTYPCSPADENVQTVSCVDDLFNDDDTMSTADPVHPASCPPSPKTGPNSTELGVNKCSDIRMPADVPPDECHYQELDYSYTLRQELYEKDEQLSH